MLWFLLALGAALSWAATNLIDKYLVIHLRHPMTVNTLGAMLAGVFGMGIVFLRHDPVPVRVAIYGMITGICGFVAVTCYLFALHHEEATRVIPLWGLTDVLVVLLAFFFLHQPLTVGIVIAVVMVVLGSILIESDFKHHLITRKPKIIALMVMASLVWATGVVVAAHALAHVHPLTLLGWAEIGAAALALFFFLFHHRRMFQGLALRLAIPNLLLTTALDELGTLAKFGALSLTYAASVEIVSGSQDLFVFMGAVLLGRISPKLLKEKNDRSAIVTKLIATLLIVGGVALIAILAPG